MSDTSTTTYDFNFEDEIDDDELDLVKLVTTNANDLNQYLVFKGSNDEYYATNVSKIEEVMVYDGTIDMAINNEKNSLIHATADIRNSMTTLIYFDDWFGNKRLDDSEYELILLTNYGGHKLGVIVKEVMNINTIDASCISDDAQINVMTSFISKITLDSNEYMCSIYDGDKMLLDVFDTIEKESSQTLNNNLTTTLINKNVYYADDSKFIRDIIEKLFIKLGVKYKIFNDGIHLVEYLDSHPNCAVDLFITDLEMPNMGGKEVIENIRVNSYYNDTAILIHTNMSNSVIKEELLSLGANEVISKINLEELSEAMSRVLKK